MRSFAAAFRLSLFLWAAATLTAHAEFIPWKYDWTADQSVLNADAPGTSKILLSETHAGLSNASGSTDVVAANIRISSTAPPTAKDTFTDKGYGLTLFLLDEQSGQSGTLEFGGVFNGSVSSLSSNLTHTFVGDETQSLILGNHEFTVNIGPYTPPGPPGSTNAGAVSAFAQVEVREVQHAPEPSTMVLSGIGLSMLGLVGWRKKRSPSKAE